MSRPPCLALTVGDPCGIGGEIALRLLAEGVEGVRLLLVGDAGALGRDARLVPSAALPPTVGDAAAWAAGEEAVGLLEPAAPLPDDLVHGAVDPRAGAACHAWVLAAARLARAGVVDGLVTGPINKAAWHAAGISSPGHTEALADLAGADRVLMMLVGGPLRVALATIHVPLASVPGRLDTAGLRRDLGLLAREVARSFGPERPRIAVCGLNPHAGEGGLFGREEEAVIAPAVEAARADGVDAHGPLPADACLPAAADGGYDAVLAMFHDQGLPVVKALAPRRAVNVTLGLPFLRTSVDHGTAFDVAGRGVAKATSLRAAVELAATMARRARAIDEGSRRGGSTQAHASPMQEDGRTDAGDRLSSM